MKTAPTSPPHILLVDDNRDGLLVRRLLLEEIGCRVEVATNGEEGLKLFESSNFDVVVADYRMPRMNGVEMIAACSRGRTRMRASFCSPACVEPLGLTEENTGADAVIAKNATEPAHLARWIKRLLNRAPARKPPGETEARRDAGARNGAVILAHCRAVRPVLVAIAACLASAAASSTPPARAKAAPRRAAGRDPRLGRRAPLGEGHDACATKWRSWSSFPFTAKRPTRARGRAGNSCA